MSDEQDAQAAASAGLSTEPPAQPGTLCLPCVSAWRDEETGRTVYIAEIRYRGSMPAPPPLQRPEGRPSHELKVRAFAELAAEVRKLPALLQSFEVVIGGRTFTNAELAAQAVETEMPVCERPIQAGSAWARLYSIGGVSKAAKAVTAAKAGESEQIRDPEEGPD